MPEIPMSEPASDFNTDYSVADAYKDAMAETPAEDAAAVVPTPGTDTPDSADPTAVTLDTEDEGEEGEGEGEDDAAAEDYTPLSERIQLSEDAAEAFPAEAKRIRAHIKGLEKVEKQLRDSKAHYDGLTAWESALSDPRTALPNLQQLVRHTVATHGLSVDDLLSGLTQDSAPTKAEFAYDTDAQVYERAKRDAKAEFAAEYGLDPGFINELKAERAQKQAASAHEAKLDKVANGTIAQADKQLGGWAVSRDMVGQAIAKFPTMKPLEAVKAAYAESYAQHMVAVATKSVKKLPSMPSSSTAKGFSVPSDPLEYTARHAYAETVGN